MRIIRSILMAVALLVLAEPATLLVRAEPAAAASQSLFPARQLGPSNRLSPLNRPLSPAYVPKLKRAAPQKPAGRPELRSYQPYAGLQYRFRPKPPVERSIRAEAPEITTPKRVEPLVEDGKLSLGYAYCAEPRENIGLPGARFGGPPAPSRTCP